MLIQIKKVTKLATNADIKATQDRIIKLHLIQVIFEVKVILKMMVPKLLSVSVNVYRYFKKIDHTDQISSWKSIGSSDELIKPPNTSDNSLAPELSYTGNKTRVKSKSKKEDF